MVLWVNQFSMTTFFGRNKKLRSCQCVTKLRYEGGGGGGRGLAMCHFTKWVKPRVLEHSLAFSRLNILIIIYIAFLVIIVSIE